MEKKDLEKMPISKLRDEAMKYKDQISGTIHEMDKPQLVKALMEVLGIKEEEPPAEKVKKIKIVDDKTSLKQKIRASKRDKDEALKAKDKTKVRQIRKRIKHLKRKIKRLSRAA